MPIAVMAKSDVFPELATQRLILRRIVPGDADAVHAFLGDTERMRFWNMPVSASPAQTAKFIDTWLGRTTSPYDHFAWGLTLRDGGACVGMVNYYSRSARNRRLEIGYVVASAHQGKALGREAVAALLDYCDDRLGVHRVDALIHPDNAASIKLATRLGFACDGGPLRDYWRVGDQYISPMIYGRISDRSASTPGDNPDKRADK